MQNLTQMNYRRWNFIIKLVELPKLWMGKYILPLTLVSGFATCSLAQQFDAPYYELQKKHGSKWIEEDKAISTKLDELQKKFGTKPNIIYILTDDIGYGELGCQGGGAMRGAPTPHLDRMAQEGFLLNGFTPHLLAHQPVLP